MNNTPYEIFGDADSGHLRIMTEGDRETIGQAREIMSRFSKVLPSSKAFSGHATKEDVVDVEPILEELKGLSIYNTPSDAEVKAFTSWLNKRKAADVSGMPITVYVKGDDGKKVKDFTTVGEFLKDSSAKKEYMAKLSAAFQEQKAKKMSFQLGQAYGRINAACDKAGLPRRQHGKWVNA